MTANNSTYSSYRWIMFALGVLAALGQTIVWLSPAPLLTTIVQDLRVDFGRAGMLLTIITFISGIFMVAGSFVIDKLGIKKAMMVAMFVMGMGGILSFFAKSYAVILTARIIVGIGCGLVIPGVGALVMSWFPPKEQPYINTMNSALGYVGFTLAFLIIIPIFTMVKTWQNTLGVLGIYATGVAILWTLFGRVHTASVAQGRGSADGLESGEISVKKDSGLSQAAKRKEVWCIAIAMVGVMWTFNTFTTFLPAYFEKIRGFDVAKASNITSLLPMMGIIAGLVCGFATGTLGLRKPFLWPMMVLILIGAVGSLMIPSGALLYLCIGLIGWGNAGWAPAFMTVPMELEGATAEMVGGAIAIIFGTGFIVSYFVPIAFEALMPSWGMYKTMLVFGFSMILSIVTLFIIPETGPKSKTNS